MESEFETFLDTPKGFIVFLVFLAWTLIWKGMALWKSAKQESKPWFIALLILNTAGILPILYVYVFGKKKKELDSSEASPEVPVESVSEDEN